MTSLRPATSEHGSSSGHGDALPRGTQFVVRRRLYTLMDVIGQGGFGITYLATVQDDYSSAPKRKVVIKEHFIKDMCHRSPNGEVVPIAKEKARFHYFLKGFARHEAQRLMELRHTHIIYALDAFRRNGTAYYVMPRCASSGNLATRAESIRRSRRTLLYYLSALLSALVYLQNRNITHRDIKPSNILLDRRGAPVLIDFGTSRPIENYDQGISRMIRTTGYAPPELESHTGFDVYSLGMVFKCFLLGYHHPDSDKIATQSLSNNAGLLAIHGRDILLGLDKATSPARATRWQSAREWWNDLQRIIAQDTPHPHTDDEAPTRLLVQDALELNRGRSEPDAATWCIIIMGLTIILLLVLLLILR